MKKRGPSPISLLFPLLKKRGLSPISACKNVVCPRSVPSVPGLSRSVPYFRSGLVRRNLMGQNSRRAALCHLGGGASRSACSVLLTGCPAMLSLSERGFLTNYWRSPNGQPNTETSFPFIRRSEWQMPLLRSPNVGNRTSCVCDSIPLKPKASTSAQMHSRASRSASRWRGHHQIQYCRSVRPLQ